MKNHQDAHRIFEGLCQLFTQVHEKVSKAEIKTRAEFITLGTEVQLVTDSYNKELDNLLRLGVACMGLLFLLEDIQKLAVQIGQLLMDMGNRIDNIEAGKATFIEMVGEKPKTRVWN